MKILIISDTHGQNKELKEVLRKTKPVDYLFHCGDTEGMEDSIRAAAGCPSTIVKGNNDFFSDLMPEEVVEVAGKRIFITHGHRYGVSMSTAHLIDEAKDRECDIVMFGHTHRPYLDQTDPALTVLNPGSLSYPRQDGRRPSYITVDVDRFGEWHYTINYLNRGRPRFW